VYGTTEMGANPALSWFGLLGYASASAFPALIIAKIGPSIREVSFYTRQRIVRTQIQSMT
jgi:hypothetical protein